MFWQIFQCTGPPLGADGKTAGVLLERLCGGVWWTWFGGKGIKRPEQRILCSGLAPPAGFEPVACRLGVRPSLLIAS